MIGSFSAGSIVAGSARMSSRSFVMLLNVFRPAASVGHAPPEYAFGGEGTAAPGGGSILHDAICTNPPPTPVVDVVVATVVVVVTSVELWLDVVAPPWPPPPEEL